MRSLLGSWPMESVFVMVSTHLQCRPLLLAKYTTRACCSSKYTRTLLQHALPSSPIGSSPLHNEMVDNTVHTQPRTLCTQINNHKSFVNLFPHNQKPDHTPKFFVPLLPYHLSRVRTKSMHHIIHTAPLIISTDSSNMPELRRSTRPKTPSKKALEFTLQFAGIEKRRSSRIAAQHTAAGKQNKFKSKQRPTNLQIALTDFVVNDTKVSSPIPSDSESNSDSDSDFDTSCPSSPDGEEFANLSGDNIEYMAGDDLDRRGSYDSRLESGNEDYERDDFVVDDDCSDGVSDAGSEITITQEVVGERGWRYSSSSSRTETDGKRKDSLTSHSSASSGLFVTDDDDDEVHAASPTIDVEIIFKALATDFDPADVAEEIVDAVPRFSRRCNRHCEPLRLSLTAEMFADDEVADAVHLAVKQGVGRYEKVQGGRVLCTVGPGR